MLLHTLVSPPSPSAALALVPCPKERPLWLTGAHHGARGALDELKAAWGGRLAHHGGPPKILWGNLLPAAIADRRIGLQPYPPRGKGWLVCNLAYTTDWHRVLQEMDARAAGSQPTVTTDRHRLPGVLWTREVYQAWARRPCPGAAQRLHNTCAVAGAGAGAGAVPPRAGPTPAPADISTGRGLRAAASTLAVIAYGIAPLLRESHLPLPLRFP